MSEKITDPGLGEKYFKKTKRVINSDGSFNVTITGGAHSIRDIFQYLINMSWSRFLFLLLTSYVVINVVFALLYMLFGVKGLSGFEKELPYPSFLNAFFFSIQTFSAVGYGRVNPESLSTNVISAVESLVGLVSYALVTGLIYGRFSRPKAKILFSKSILYSPYKDGHSIQFRIANRRSLSQLMEIEAKAILTLVDEEFNRKYFALKLEPSSIRFFPLSWTIVHPIDEDSPFYEKGIDYYKSAEGEVLILIKGFDETFSQEVFARSSYLLKDVICNAKFKRMFETDDSGEVLLHLKQINDIEKL